MPIPVITHFCWDHIIVEIAGNGQDIPQCPTTHIWTVFYNRGGQRHRTGFRHVTLWLPRLSRDIGFGSTPGYNFIFIFYCLLIQIMHIERAHRWYYLMTQHWRVLWPYIYAGLWLIPDECWDEPGLFIAFFSNLCFHDFCDYHFSIWNRLK